MRARGVLYKKSGVKHIQYTSPGYGGWCSSRNKVRLRVKLEPLVRKTCKATTAQVAVEGGAPLRVDLPADGVVGDNDATRDVHAIPGGSFSAVDEIDEID